MQYKIFYFIIIIIYSFTILCSTYNVLKIMVINKKINMNTIF